MTLLPTLTVTWAMTLPSTMSSMTPGRWLRALIVTGTPSTGCRTAHLAAAARGQGLLYEADDLDPLQHPNPACSALGHGGRRCAADPGRRGAACRRCCRRR